MGNTVGRSSNSIAELSNVPEFDNIPEDNGIIFLGKAVPEEIIYYIFLHVPGKDLVLSVSRVCKYWNEMLLDTHFWFKKLQVEGIALSETTRRKLMNVDSGSKTLRLLKELDIRHPPFNKNLVLNPSGREKLKHWKVQHGGDGLRVETKPTGSDPIPDEVGLPTQHCFVTSYRKCMRRQIVNLSTLGFTPLIMDMLRPNIVISEWVCARFDCSSESQLYVSLDGRVNNRTVELNWSSDDEDVDRCKWYELKEVVTDYPEGLHRVNFASVGGDRQFWAGHYGVKSAGSCVMLIL